MAHLQYSSYAGTGVQYSEASHYSQAVKVGDKIDCAGQGGWGAATGKIPEDVGAQLENAFKNIDVNLKNAGGKGWSQVYKVRSYHVALDDAVLERMVALLKEYMPEHRPILTVLGVAALAFKEMKVEIDVTAHIGD